MSMQEAPAPRFAHSVVRLARWSLAIVVLALTVAVAPASALVIVPTRQPLDATSGFQGADGNQDNPTAPADADNPPPFPVTRDWQALAGSPNLVSRTDPNPDDAFTSGSKEEAPEGWVLEDVAAGSTPSKANFFASWAYLDNDTYLYLAFEREVSGGNAFLAFELNQDQRLWQHAQADPNTSAFAPNRPIQCRTTGDVIVSYEIQNSDNVDMVIQRWVSDTVVLATGADATNYPGAAGCAKTGHFEVFDETSTPPLTNADVQGAINAVNSANPVGPITNYLPGATSSTIDTEKFGEAAINLTSVFSSGALGDPCFSFGRISMHSRSSESGSAAMQDQVGGQPIALRSCSISGTKWDDQNGDGVRDAGEPVLAGYKVFLDLNDDGDRDGPAEPIATTNALGEYLFEDIPNGTYVVREVPAAEQDPAFQDYVCTFPSPCNYTATIDAAHKNRSGLDFGNWVPPKVTVAKEVLPDGSAETFQFTSTLPGFGNFTLTDNQNTGAITTGAGTVSISETLDASRFSLAIDCTGVTENTVGSTTTFSVQSGSVVVCTFTNTMHATVTYQKVTDPVVDAADFAFDATGGGLSGETLDTDPASAGTPSSHTDTLDASELAGSKSIAETVPAGWTLTTVECTNTSASRIGDSVSFTVGAGDQIVCTFTNTHLPHITVTKVTLPADLDQTFSYTGLGGFTLNAASDPSDDFTVAAGSYPVTETVPAGWDLTSLSCTDPDGGTTTASATATIDADAGEDITCTFTNTQRGSVAVTKTEAGGQTLSRAWTFTLTGGPTPGVDLTATTPAPLTFGDLKPGTYTLCEKAVPSDWISSLERAPYNAVREPDGDVCVELTLSAGELEALTVDNTRPQAIVVKEGNVLIHPGDTITYTFDVTNAGNVPLHDVTLSDARCQTAITRDPAHDQNADADAVLENPGVNGTTSESWRFTCGFTVPANHGLGDENPIVNTVTATAVAPDGTQVSDSDNHTTTVLHPDIEVDKQVRREGQGQFGDAPVQVKVGEVLEYRFLVTNPGDAGLTVAFSDPRCDAGTLTAPTKTGGDADDSLEPGETWTYTCSHKVLAGDPDPFPNTVTVTGTDALGGPNGTPTDTDTTTNPVIAPRIAVDKTVRVGTAGDFVQGPVTATVGDTLAYRFAVTNPGDVPLTSIALSDPRCDAGTLSGPVKTGGNDDASLDPGETWTYSCTHVLTATDPRPFANTATMTGTDPLGATTTATDSATAQVSTPAQVVSPVHVVGPLTLTSARLSSPNGCQPKRFTVRVSGTGISLVTFYVDGKLVKRIKATSARKVKESRANAGATQEFHTTVDPTRYKSGTHRVTAKVQFVASSKRRSRRLLATFARCSRAVVSPRFTG